MNLKTSCDISLTQLSGKHANHIRDNVTCYLNCAINDNVSQRASIERMLQNPDKSIFRYLQLTRMLRYCVEKQLNENNAHEQKA